MRRDRLRERERRRKRRDERERSNLKDERDGENGWSGSLRKKERERDEGRENASQSVGEGRR